MITKEITVHTDTLKENQSQTIEWLRLPLTIMVLFVHMNPQSNPKFIELSNIIWTDGINMQELYSLLSKLITTFANAAVPCFFLFSGYFFFHKLSNWGWAVYLEKIKKRLKTLIIPYILWNIIALIAAILIAFSKKESISAYLLNLWQKGILHIFWDSTTWNEHNVNIFGWSQQNWGPEDLPLWFLRDLIVITFLSPIIFAGVKYFKQYFVLFLGVFYIFDVWTNLPGLSITAFFYFSIGAYWSISRKNVVAVLSKRKYLYWIIALISLILIFVFKVIPVTKLTAKLTLQLYTLTGVFSIITLASIGIRKRIIKANANLANASFFLYCIHTILVLTLCRLIMEKLLGNTNPASIVTTYLTAPVLCTMICLGLVFFLKRITP